jgi:hypothetical protein
MSIYLLEIYNTGSNSIPDFGLVFNTIDILLDYVNTQIEPVDETIQKSAKENLVVGWSIGLNKSGSLRATKMPLVSDSKNATYTKYFKGEPKTMPPINDTQEEISVPKNSERINFISGNTIEDEDIIMNFNHLINKPGSPNYLKRTSFNKQNRPHINPLTLLPIKTSIKTRKVKIVK